jgi:tetratricopeptide (TPR) repeat protein
MRCPYCKTDNPALAATCVKCGRPAPQSEATFLGDGAEGPASSGTSAAGKPASSPPESSAVVAAMTPTNPGTPAGWSVAATKVPIAALVQGEFPAGTVLGERYEILSLLGQGGMGAVYKVRDRELDRLVALKLIRPELTTNPEILKRFKQELILARQITHRNVIRIFDLAQADGFKFITMEYLEGKDLRVVLRERTKFPPDESAKIVLQICRALEAAHAEGVIHRDLKPQNIMLDANGRAYVMDFGIARSAYLPGMTQTGALVGTPEYMSPEQAKGDKLDERSDLFSLGVILYELLIGQSPYYSETPLATLWKRIQEKAKPPIEIDPAIPKPLSDIVAKALEIDPANRYASAAEFAQALEVWLGLSPSKIASLGEQAPAAALAKAGRWKYATFALIALLVAVAGLGLPKRFFSGSAKKGPADPTVLAVMPLRNASGDASLDWLSTTLAEVLRTEIGQSSDFRTAAPDRMQQVLSDLRIGPDSEVAASDVQHIADFTKAKLIVAGQYSRNGDRIRIEAKLQDLKSQRNESLSAEAPQSDILSAVASLAQSVQQKLGATHISTQALTASAFKPSTTSLDAIHNYVDGMTKARQGNYIDAVKDLESATKADPNFALAYSTLGQTYARLGYDREAEQNASRSVDLSANVSPVEKLLVQGVNAKIGNHYDKAVTAFESLEQLMPNDPQVQFELGELFETQGDYDKAHAHYEKAVLTDPKHLEALRGIGQVEYERGNPQGSLDYLNRALTLAVELNNRQGKAIVLHDLGEAYRLLNRPQDALQNFAQSLQIKKEIGDKKGTAASLDEVAMTYGIMGKPADAESNFQEELAIRKDIGDQSGMGIALLNYGAFLQDSGRYEDSLGKTKQALQIEMQLGHEPRQAVCLSNIGWSYFKMAQYDDALTYQQRAIEQLQKSGNPGDLASNLNNLGLTYSRIGQFEKASKSYSQALENARKIGDKVLIAAISDSIADLLSIQGRYGAALKAQQEATAIDQQLQQGGDFSAEIQADYANILTRSGRSDEAGKILDTSLKEAESSKNDALAAKVLNFQGELFLLNGDLKSARSSLEKSQQAATRAKDRMEMLVAKLNLAKVAVREGRAAANVPILKQIAKDADTLDVKYLAAQASLALGEAMLESGDAAHSVAELQSALRKSEDLGIKSLQPEAHFLLSRALSKAGNATEADRHLKLAASLIAGMQQESGASSLAQRSDFRKITQQTGN